MCTKSCVIIIIEKLRLELFLKKLKYKYKNRLCTGSAKAYTSTLGLLTYSLTHWITDSLTHPSVHIMLLKVEKSYFGKTLTKFWTASHLANSLFGGNNLDHVCFWRAIRNHQPFNSDYCANLVTISYTHTRSLAEAKLEQFCYGFIACHLEV